MPKSQKVIKAQKDTRVDATGETKDSLTAAEASEVPTGIFELTDTTYVDVMWFAAWENTDWMAMLSKPTADGAWTLVYRFRYYAPDEGIDQIWDSKDRKSSYRLTTGATDTDRAKVEATTDMLIDGMVSDAMALCGLGRKAKLIVRGGSDRAIELLSVQDWAHMKRIPVNTAASRDSK